MAILRQLAACGLLAVLVPATAAESEDACVGFVDTIPATIASQGVWCLRKDLSTALATGNAIDIQANNVTIDCNGYKLGGLAGGDGTLATGISALNRRNLAVRNCTIRGFKYGIHLSGEGGGHLVESNRVDQSTAIGILVLGYDDGSLVRDNRVGDTGGSPDTSPIGISAAGDVMGNTVVGVSTSRTDDSVLGIAVHRAGARAHGNQVRGLVRGPVGQGGGSATAISMSIDGSARGNHVANVPSVFGWGISGFGICSDNQIQGFSTALVFCVDAGGNASQP